MIFRYFFAMLMVATPVWGAATEGARSLTVELWATRSLTHLTVTPVNSQQVPLQVEWLRDGLQTSAGTKGKQLELSGSFRMQASGPQQSLNGHTHFYIVINDEHRRSTPKRHS